MIKADIYCPCCGEQQTVKLDNDVYGCSECYHVFTYIEIEEPNEYGISENDLYKLVMKRK